MDSHFHSLLTASRALHKHQAHVVVFLIIAKGRRNSGRKLRREFKEINKGYEGDDHNLNLLNDSHLLFYLSLGLFFVFVFLNKVSPTTVTITVIYVITCRILISRDQSIFSFAGTNPLILQIVK